MNRREFSQMLLGSGAAASLPMPSLAKPAVVAAEKGKYIWAVAVANAHETLSAQSLARALNVTNETAVQLMGRLAARGVVQSPGAAGVARVIAPTFRQGALEVVSSSAPTVGAGMKAPSTENLNRIVKNLRNARTPEHADTDEPAKNDAVETPVTPDAVCAPPAASDAEHSAE